MNPFRRIERATSCSSMSAEDLRLQGEHSRAGDLLAFFDPNEDLHAITVLAPELHGAWIDRECVMSDEEGLLAVDADHRTARNDQRSSDRCGGVDLGQERLPGSKRNVGM